MHLAMQTNVHRVLPAGRGGHVPGKRVAAEGREFTGEGGEGLKKVEGERKGREMREEEITNVGEEGSSGEQRGSRERKGGARRRSRNAGYQGPVGNRCEDWPVEGTPKDTLERSLSRDLNHPWKPVVEKQL